MPTNLVELSSSVGPNIHTLTVHPGEGEETHGPATSPLHSSPHLHAEIARDHRERDTETPRHIDGMHGWTDKLRDSGDNASAQSEERTTDRQLSLDAAKLFRLDMRLDHVLSELDSEYAKMPPLRRKKEGRAMPFEAEEFAKRRERERRVGALAARLLGEAGRQDPTNARQIAFAPMLQRRSDTREHKAWRPTPAEPKVGRRPTTARGHKQHEIGALLPSRPHTARHQTE